eukprot:549944_1
MTDAFDPTKPAPTIKEFQADFQPTLPDIDAFHEVKEAIVDWWHPSPMETNNETHGAIPFTGYKMRECRWFATPGAFCSKRESCTYAHGLKELRQYNPLAKTIPCQWGERCQHMLEYGVCNYIHKKKKKSKKKKKAVKK